MIAYSEWHVALPMIVGLLSVTYLCTIAQTSFVQITEHSTVLCLLICFSNVICYIVSISLNFTSNQNMPRKPHQVTWGLMISHKVTWGWVMVHASPNNKLCNDTPIFISLSLLEITVCLVCVVLAMCSENDFFMTVVIPSPLSQFYW